MGVSKMKYDESYWSADDRCLNTGQPSLPKLPVEPLFQLDNPVPQSAEEPSNEGRSRY
jgi:hypothetical protein